MSSDPQPLASAAGQAGLTATRRFDLASLAGPLADLAAFALLLQAGVAVVPAQLASFVVGLAIGYFTQLRQGLRDRDVSVTSAPHGWLGVTALTAAFLRAGVLGLGLKWGWPAPLSILPAILASTWVVALGRELLLSPVELSRQERLRQLALALMGYSFVLRLVYAGQVELLPEEAYYWNYSQHPALGYLDHPPMVAWVISVGTWLLGNTEMGVRLGPLLTQGIATFFAWRMTRELFGAAAALAAVVLMQVLPYFFLAGLVTTPDAPLLAAWAGCLYFLQRALLQDRSRAWWGVGVCLGVGLLSKYTIGLLVPSAVLFMLLDRQARHWLWSWRPWAAAGLAAAIFSPVLMWNSQHEWASFAFQTSRRLQERPRFELHRLLLSILLLITPTGLASLPFILGKRAAPYFGEKSGGEDAEQRRKRLFARVFVLLPLAVYCLFSLRHEIKLDWTGPLWLAALPALAHWLCGTGDRQEGSRLRAAWAPTAAATLLILGTFLGHLALGVPGLPNSPKMELLPVGWQDLAAQIRSVANALPAENGQPPLVVGMERYAIASELAFYAPDQKQSVANTASVNLFGPMGVMYEQWFPAQAQQGRTLVLVAWTPQELTDERIATHATSLEPLKSIAVMRDGKLIRRVYYRIVHGYRLALAPQSPG